MQTPDVLQKIVVRKREHIASMQREVALADLKARAAERTDFRGFEQAITSRVKEAKPAVISEIKKASPSKGVIRESFDPPAIAVSYASAGAACLSVLTDEPFFQGADAYLVAARAACELPVLRKDFVVDPYQVYESAALGADCILLIAAILTADEMRDLSQLANDLGLDVLVEVHNEEELEMALGGSPSLLGINNRNLHNFEVSLATTWRLLEQIDGDMTVVTESGIHTRDDVTAMTSRGIHAFLVGEAFMKADDPGDALRALFFEK